MYIININNLQQVGALPGFTSAESLFFSIEVSTSHLLYSKVSIRCQWQFPYEFLDGVCCVQIKACQAIFEEISINANYSVYRVLFIRNYIGFLVIINILKRITVSNAKQGFADRSTLNSRVSSWLQAFLKSYCRSYQSSLPFLNHLLQILTFWVN